jgi:hypothetical protein
MRTRVMLDVPDPSANGGFTVPKSIDQNIAPFQAAARACNGFLRAGLPHLRGS